MLSQTRLSIIRNHRFPRVITSQRNSSSYAGNKVLGIVREKHGMWERRAPLSPNQVRKLLDDLPGSKVLIQPCTRRIFTNDQYSAAGAIITEDLSHANFILGVKSMKAEDLMPSKSYMFFSHTIKAQPYSMPLLDTILEKKVRLFDYECITKDGRDDTPRLVAFGGYAGRAGMIDGLQGLGLRLLAEGYSTPFLHMPNTYMHRSLNEVRDRLRIVGDMISSSGFPPALSPMVFAFTGTGNVAKGALEIFEHLPHEFITVKELPNLKKDIEDGKRPANKIYAVKLKTSDLVRHKTDPYKFSRDDYYRFPENYEPKFHETVLPHITMLVNGIYWDARFPRLLTKENIASLRKAGNHNFRAVADISCDIDGSVEFLSRPTSIENPFYMYNPEMDTIQDNVTSDGILMLGVDNLPTELPADATEHFGERLLPLLPPLLTSTDGNYENLPAELKRACIANNGSLTPKWAYISRLREQTSVLTNAATPTIAPKSYVRLEIMGHLFDTGLIIHVLDSLELVQEVNFSIINCEVRPNTSAGPKHSRFLIQLSGSDASKVKQVAENVRDLVAGHPFAEGSCHIHSDSVKHIDVRTPKRVLLFGAGRVAVPVAKLFAQKDNVHLTIATEEESQAKALMSYMPGLERSSFHPFKYPADIGILPDLIKSSDLVISLLPATMHAPLAAEAVRQKRHMVTASYVSPDMRALHKQAAAEGVILLNEIGLDPGIDHMLVMEAVDSIHKKGGVVRELVSLCGGLPDPVAAENPLRYKFSWSPRGVLTASGNPAQFLSQGKVISVKGEDLLRSATPSNRFPTLRMEVLPNRDSLMYRDLYNVPDVHSICRGTLRYEGWANAMYAFKTLGFLNPQVSGNGEKKSVLEYMKQKFPSGYDTQALRQYFTDNGVSDVDLAMEAVNFLGMNQDCALELAMQAHRATAATPIDAFCQLLESKLAFAPTEKDMVAMFHSIVGELPDGTIESHASRLLAFGTPGGDSAMSATVGYTTAAAAELILDDHLAQTDVKGVVIPTDSRIYEPLLKRIQDFGITWTNTITTTKKK